MNRGRIEQGIGTYVSDRMTAAGYVVAADGVGAPTINVTPAKDDRNVVPGIPVVVVILERIPNQAGPFAFGELRIQIQKNGASGDLEDYLLILDAISDAFPGQYRDDYASRKAELHTEIFDATGDRVTCSGFALLDPGEDVEDSDRWIDDVTVRLGLVDSTS